MQREGINRDTLGRRSLDQLPQERLEGSRILGLECFRVSQSEDNTSLFIERHINRRPIFVNPRRRNRPSTGVQVPLQNTITSGFSDTVNALTTSVSKACFMPVRASCEVNPSVLGRALGSAGRCVSAQDYLKTGAHVDLLPGYSAVPTYK